MSRALGALINSVCSFIVLWQKSFLNLSSRTIYNLAHGLPGNFRLPYNITEPLSLSGKCTGAIKVKRLNSPIAEHFQEKAPQLFRGARFQTKAPQLSCKILTSCTQPGRLMVKLQGSRAETSDLIFIRKTQHFPKMHQFSVFRFFNVIPLRLSS